MRKHKKLKAIVYTTAFTPKQTINKLHSFWKRDVRYVSIVFKTTYPNGGCPFIISSLAYDSNFLKFSLNDFASLCAVA